MSSDAESFVCVSRQDINQRRGGCAAEVCNGSAPYCPPGQSCQSGVCRSTQPPRATCGSTRCPADRPICLWQGKTGTCVDVARASQAESSLMDGSSEVSRLGCTRTSDCPGWVCCTGGSLGARYTSCQGQCDLANTMQVCTSDAECRPLLGACGGDEACRESFRCRPVPGGPPGLSTCAAG
ncbi:MAG: hypothetical protein EOO75_19970 [Myxococcales bacterium]|nr:MAG: hypothetical protein EOO75_19970 [Myxococcales bacterium]